MLKFLTSLLNVDEWPGNTADGNKVRSGTWTSGTWGHDFVSALRPILIVICVAVAIVASAYAVYLAFMLAKAEDDGARKAAKSRIMKVIAGLLFIIILGSTFGNTAFINMLFGVTKDWERTAPDNSIAGFPVSKDGTTPMPIGEEIPLSAFIDGEYTAPGVQALFEIVGENTANAQIVYKQGVPYIIASTSGRVSVRLTTYSGHSTPDENNSGPIEWYDSKTVTIPVTFMTSTDFAEIVAYEIRFWPNGGTLSTGQQYHTVRFTPAGDGANITYDKLFGIYMDGKYLNDTKRIWYNGYGRQAWSPQQHPPMASYSSSIVNIDWNGKHKTITALAADSRFTFNTNSNGIAVLNVYAVWVGSGPQPPAWQPETGQPPVVTPGSPAQPQTPITGAGDGFKYWPFAGQKYNDNWHDGYYNRGGVMGSGHGGLDVYKSGTISIIAADDGYASMGNCSVTIEHKTQAGQPITYSIKDANGVNINLGTDISRTVHSQYVHIQPSGGSRWVKAGDVIGSALHPGNCSGCTPRSPHLHYEVYIKGLRAKVGASNRNWGGGTTWHTVFTGRSDKPEGWGLIHPLYFYPKDKMMPMTWQHQSCVGYAITHEFKASSYKCPTCGKQVEAPPKPCLTSGCGLKLGHTGPHAFLEDPVIDFYDDAPAAQKQQNNLFAAIFYLMIAHSSRRFLFGIFS